MKLLKDNVALITGAGSGIGKAIAVALGKEGAKLCLVGRNAEKLEIVAAIVRENGSEAKCYPTDLSVSNNISALADQLGKDFEELDILIHSAGFISLGVIEGAAINDLDQHYYVNVRAPYILTQLLLPMLKHSKGQVVFVNSTVAMMTARAKQSQYAATKHALKAFADSLRDEVNADGIRVLSVYPGRTATPMQAAVHKMEGQIYHPESLMQPDDIAGVIINTLRTPRSVEIIDITIRPSVKVGQ